MASPRATDPLQHPLPWFAVSRPILERRLDRIGPGGIGLLVASAGSGKSVLLRQWAAGRPQLRIAALALTRRHDDAVVMARELLDALRVAVPELGPELDALVLSGGSALGRPFVDELRSVLGAMSQDLVVVIEDVHLLTNRDLVDDLGQIATDLPHTARLVASTRRDPPWLNHRFRLDSRNVEVRDADLAFGLAQARQLLVAVSDRQLTDHDVRLLTHRTEGWVAGLQLAAISLQRTRDVSAAIESFSGSDVLIAEYLLEEVIEQQPVDVRRFLARTSVLDWLSVELCNAVTGEDNARSMLDELQSRSLLLIPLDSSGELFRYHHLFADLLRHRLRVQDPTVAPELHIRAAEWLVDQGRAEESVEHLLAAASYQQAFELITTSGQQLFERGESVSLLRWLSTIQEGWAEAPTGVEVNLLAAQLAADRTEGAFETHRRLCRRPDLALGERTAADALYALLVFRGLPPEVALKTSARVLDSLPLLEASDVADFLGVGGLDSIEVIARYAAAVARFLQGDLDRSASDLQHALTLPGMDYPLWKVYTLGSLALTRAWTGHCTQALQLAESAIEVARAVGVATHSGVTHAHLALAIVQLDRTELDHAERSLIESGLQNRRRVSSVAYFDLQRALEARLAAAAQGPTEALAILREPPASAIEPAVLLGTNRALSARLLIARGDPTAAGTVLEGLEETSELTAARIDVALASSDLATAGRLLDRWQPSGSDLRAVVGRLLRSAALHEAQGDPLGAEAALREAVARAEPERLRWPFIEVPGALRLLRRQARPGSPFTDDALLHLAERLQPARYRQDALVEPLTSRELTILQYLPRRDPNEHIANDLFISVNTVKSHLRSIYRKLDAADRDAAVARATELGLL